MSYTSPTAAEVVAILDSNTRITTTTVLPFIVAAQRITADRLANQGISDDTLKEIEKWVAAHLASMAIEPQAQSESVGDASKSYMSQGGKGFEATRYGQMAMILDPSGSLASSSKQKIIFEALDFEDGGSS